jgi:hypothetical protein
LSSGLLSKNTKIKIYRTIILPVVYGCETWSLTLREERRLRVFENRVLRRIFWSKRDEVKEERKKLYSEELNDMCFSPSIVRVTKSRRIRWVGHVARMGEMRVVYRVLVGNVRERNHSEDLGVYEDNIKMDVQEVGCGRMDWIELAQVRDR